MAFPVVEATNTSTELSATTSHTVSLPASIASGELLIVLFGRRESFVQNITGWNKSRALSHSTDTDVTDIDVFTRTADGTEGATLAVTTNGSRKSAHIAYRISGWDSFELSSNAESSGTGNPDPPSLTPAGGAADYLWIAIAGAHGARTITGAPTNYGSLLNPSTGTGVGEANIGSAVRSLNASTEDPGAFTADNVEEWVALTIAVAPAGAGAPNDPTGVVASNPTATTVDLDWTDTNSASAFPRLYRRTPAGSGGWTFVEQLASAAATSYTFTGLASATEYDFGVSYADS